MDDQEKCRQGWLCWAESIQISIIVGAAATLLAHVIVDHIVGAYPPLGLHLHVFIGTFLLALVASRLGWIRKGKKDC